MCECPWLERRLQAAIQFKQNRLAREPDAPPEDEPTYFHFVRDYETVKVEQEVPNEFLLVLDEGTDEFETDTKGGVPRPKGAYYKNIERKMLLKKKRQNVGAHLIFLSLMLKHISITSRTRRTWTSGTSSR